MSVFGCMQPRRVQFVDIEANGLRGVGSDHSAFCAPLDRYSYPRLRSVWGWENEGEGRSVVGIDRVANTAGRTHGVRRRRRALAGLFVLFVGGSSLSAAGVQAVTPENTIAPAATQSDSTESKSNAEARAF